LATIGYSEVQTVVLTEKLASKTLIKVDGETKNNARAIRSVL